MRAEVLDLLAEGMGPGLHWFPEEFSTSHLASTLVGMANASGGIVLIGIAPRQNRILGVRDPQMVFDRVFQAALLTDPPLILPMPVIRSVEGATVVKLHVPPGLPHVYNLEGRYLTREGYQNNPLSAKRLRKLLVERGVIHFESRLAKEASLDDLDPERITAYREALQMPDEGPVEQLLLQRGCVRQEDGTFHPTFAGLLLFGRHPQRWLPSAKILVARFPGTSISDQFVKQDIGGALPEQLHQAVGFVHDNMRSIVRMVGLRRQETLEYPVDAVRELLVNAVTHRDYNQQGDSIHLRIFSDRLEVRSPGGLPGPVNLDNLLEARFSRNPVIAQVLSDLGFVERLGYGLNRVVTMIRQQGQADPHFEELGGSFRVTLYAKPETIPERRVSDFSKIRDLDLNPRQELAVNYLASHPRITNRAYQELCPQVSSETLRRDLADLVSKGVLLKIGDKRATYYILKHSYAGSL